MKTTRYIFLLFLMVLPLTAFSQKTAVDLYDGADIRFDTSEHDFGTIEENGLATFDFTFENTGKKPLEISRVATSCGCTTPSFQHEPIAPGAKSSITVSYNTEGRPGHFNKTITVYSNSKRNPTYVLSIKGNVVTDENSPTRLYPKAMGDLRLRQTSVNFREMIIGSVKNETVTLYNQSETESIMIRVSDVPKHLKVTLSNKVLDPGATAVMTIQYLSADAKDYGRRDDFFHIEVVEKGTPTVEEQFHVSALLKEDFSKVKSGKIPYAVYSLSGIHFGTVQQGKTVKAEMTLKNGGKAPLYIRKIYNPSPALKATADKMEVAPGKAVKLHFELNTKNLQSSIFYPVEFVTNDPVETTKRIVIRADISE